MSIQPPMNQPPFGGYAQATVAAVNPKAPEFRHFLETEINYHRNMVGLYEWLLAQEKLGALGNEQGEMLRSIIMAGLNQMAMAYQPKDRT